MALPRQIDTLVFKIHQKGAQEVETTPAEAIANALGAFADNIIPDAVITTPAEATATALGTESIIKSFGDPGESPISPPPPSLQETVDAVEYAITTQDVNFEITPEYFSGSSYKESIGGKRISDIRGFRLKVTFNHQASSQPNTYQELFNDLVSAFNDGVLLSTGNEFDAVHGLKIRIGLSGNLLPTKFILEDLSYTQTYRNQIGRFVPSITICSEDILTSIPDDLEGVL